MLKYFSFLLFPDKSQLMKWQNLRISHPKILATCVTNDWVLHSIMAEEKFAEDYSRDSPDTLILAAGNDRFVHNRAMQYFVRATHRANPKKKLLFIAPKAYHELLFENELIRGATKEMIRTFFLQKSDDVSQVENFVKTPFELWNPDEKIKTVPEIIYRTSMIALASVGCACGLFMIISGTYFPVWAFRKANAASSD